jgi:hypothetical protein
MASNRAKNFLRGLIATQPGISRAYVEGLISEEERKEQEKEEARQARMDRLYEQNVMSQIAAREPEEETPSLPKFSFETPEGVNISGEANEEMKKALEKYGVKPPKPEKEEKPLYTSKDVATMRERAVDNARSTLNRQRGQELGWMQQYENMEAMKAAEKEGKKLDPTELPNPVKEPANLDEIHAAADTSLFYDLGIPVEHLEKFKGDNTKLAEFLNTGKLPEIQKDDEKIKEAVKGLKAKGYTDEQIDSALVKMGYK